MRGPDQVAVPSRIMRKQWRAELNLRCGGWGLCGGFMGMTEASSVLTGGFYVLTVRFHALVGLARNQRAIRRDSGAWNPVAEVQKSALLHGKAPSYNNPGHAPLIKSGFWLQDSEFQRQLKMESGCQMLRRSALFSGAGGLRSTLHVDLPSCTVSRLFM